MIKNCTTTRVRKSVAQSVYFIAIVWTAVLQPAWSQTEKVESASALAPGASEPSAPVMISTAVLSGEAVFAYNSYVLTKESIQALDKLIKDLDDFVMVDSVKVIGHTDDRGSDKYNQQLSERRARYIAQFFSRRFPNIEVSSLGAGESSPIATNSTPEGRKRNRRVEIQVIARGANPNH